MRPRRDGQMISLLCCCCYQYRDQGNLKPARESAFACWERRFVDENRATGKQLARALYCPPTNYHKKGHGAAAGLMDGSGVFIQMRAWTCARWSCARRLQHLFFCVSQKTPDLY